MLSFTVYEPPDAPADRLDRAESLAFVKEGFSWVASAFTPFWLIANRLWLLLVFYLAGMVLLQTGMTMMGIGQRPVALAMIALHLLIGLEADTLRRWTLERTGWHFVGTVNGRNVDECERRFFESWLPRQPLIAPAALSQSRLAAEVESIPVAGELGLRPAGGWTSAFAFGRRKPGGV